VQAWVEHTCAEQGVSVKITNPVVLLYIAALFGGE